MGLSGASMGGVWRVLSTYSTSLFIVGGDPGSSWLTWGSWTVSGEGESEDECR